MKYIRPTTVHDRHGHLAIQLRHDGFGKEHARSANSSQHVFAWGEWIVADQT